MGMDASDYEEAADARAREARIEEAVLFAASQAAAALLAAPPGSYGHQVVKVLVAERNVASVPAILGAVRDAALRTACGVVRAVLGCDEMKQPYPVDEPAAASPA